MKRKSRLDDLPVVEIDMTPMIDMIFNLIIFFMLVNKMVQDERADLQVPFALQAKEEKEADKQNLVLNVHRDGKIEISGQVVNAKQFQKILADEARISKDAEGNPSRSVLIRGDFKTPYRHIQEVLWEVSQKRLYRISFAADAP